MGLLLKNLQEHSFLAIMILRLSHKVGLTTWWFVIYSKKGNSLGTMYKNYSHLLCNFYHNTYTYLINKFTKMLTSWVVRKKNFLLIILGSNCNPLGDKNAVGIDQNSENSLSVEMIRMGSLVYFTVMDLHTLLETW